MITQTRLDQLLNSLDNAKFSIAIGHGIQNKNTSVLKVPSNLYVIFMTKAGYLGHVEDTCSYGFTSLFSNKQKIIKLLRNQLNTSNLPTIITQKKWNWRRHIYPPGSNIDPGYQLEFKDVHIPSYNKLTGVWMGNQKNRWGYGYVKSIGEIMNHVSSRYPNDINVLFISGCRADPNANRKTLINKSISIDPRTQHGFIAGVQNYNIPISNYTRKIRSGENKLSRIISKKRVRVSSPNLNKSKKRKISNNLTQAQVNRMLDLPKNKKMTATVRKSRFRKLPGFVAPVPNFNTFVKMNKNFTNEQLKRVFGNKYEEYVARKKNIDKVK